MKNILLVVLALFAITFLSQKADAQMVCGPDGCYEVQSFQPVRTTLQGTVSVLERVVETPPVPVTYAVTQAVANRQFRPVKFVSTRFVRPLLARVFKPIRRIFRR